MGRPRTSLADSVSHTPDTRSDTPYTLSKPDHTLIEQARLGTYATQSVSHLDKHLCTFHMTARIWSLCIQIKCRDRRLQSEWGKKSTTFQGGQKSSERESKTPGGINLPFAKCSFHWPALLILSLCAYNNITQPEFSQELGLTDAYRLRIKCLQGKNRQAVTVDTNPAIGKTAYRSTGQNGPREVTNPV